MPVFGVARDSAKALSDENDNACLCGYDKTPQPKAASGRKGFNWLTSPQHSQSSKQGRPGARGGNLEVGTEAEAAAYWLA